MKLWKINDALTLLDQVAPEQITLAEDALPPPDVFPEKAGWLNWHVAQGIFHARSLAKDGKIFATLYYYPTARPERVLSVAACHSFDSENHLDDFEAAMDFLAREHHCKFVEFQTLRSGLVREALKRNYALSALTFIRPIK